MKTVTRLAALSLAVAAVPLVAAPARALPITGHWVSPASGTTVSGTVTLQFATAQTNAYFSVDGTQVPSQLANGTATGTLDTLPLTDGAHTVTATECDAGINPLGGVVGGLGVASGCSAPQSISLTVDNSALRRDPAAPRLVSPAAGQHVGVLNHLHITGTGTVQIFRPSNQYSYGSQQISYPLPVDVTVGSLLGDAFSGPATLQISHCPASGTCLYTPQSLSFTVDTPTPRPATRVAAIDYIGLHQTGHVSMTLPYAWSGHLEIRRPTSSIPLRVTHDDKAKAGKHQFVWDGKDAHGRHVGDGSYAVTVVATAGGRIGSAVYEPGAQVRRHLPRVTLTVGATSFQPVVQDGYLDTVQVSLSASYASKSRIDVFSGSRLVGSFTPTAGYWDGKVGGRQLPAGSYRLQGVVTDPAGNVGRSTAVSVAIGAKGLKRKHFHKVVSGKVAFVPGTGSTDCTAASVVGDTAVVSADQRCISSTTGSHAVIGLQFTVPAAYSYDKVIFETLSSGSAPGLASFLFGGEQFAGTVGPETAGTGGGGTGAGGATGDGRSGTFFSGVQPGSRQATVSVTGAVVLTGVGDLHLKSVTVDGDYFVLA